MRGEIYREFREWCRQRAIPMTTPLEAAIIAYLEERGA